MQERRDRHKGDVGGMDEEGWKNGAGQEGMDVQGRWAGVEGP